MLLTWLTLLTSLIAALALRSQLSKLKLYCFLQVAVATFAIYIFTGHDLTPSKAFVALALFDMLRAPLLQLPACIVSSTRVGIF